MIIKQAVEVLRIEAEGILKVAERIDGNFVEMVEVICRSQGRLIISGLWGELRMIRQQYMITFHNLIL